MFIIQFTLQERSLGFEAIFLVAKPWDYNLMKMTNFTIIIWAIWSGIVLKNHKIKFSN